jgi:hypothetical protein
MWKLTDAVEKLMKHYPYRSQENTEAKNVIIPVKLFDVWSSITWRLSEYEPESKVAFWYVTGFYEDEWGTVSIEELENLELVIDIEDFWKIWKIPRVEIDTSHTLTKFKDLHFNKDNSK